MNYIFKKNKFEILHPMHIVFLSLFFLYTRISKTCVYNCMFYRGFLMKGIIFKTLRGLKNIRNKPTL